MTIPSTAIGYIRVSTRMQNEGDHALKRQVEKIQTACSELGIALGPVHEDIQSATDPYSVERREGLQAATKQACQGNACLVVTEPTRLFRNVEVAERWLQTLDVPVYSLRDKKILSRSELLNAIKVGEDVAKASSAGTISALEKKRASGIILGSKADRKAANKASRLARKQRSDNIIDTLARVLSEDPAYRSLSHNAFADLLNRRNILTGWKRPWTGAGVRRQRVAAELRIEELAEIEADDVPGEIVIAPETQPVPSPVDEPDTEEEAMKKLPIYGMFS